VQYRRNFGAAGYAAAGGMAGMVASRLKRRAPSLTRVTTKRRRTSRRRGGGEMVFSKARFGKRPRMTIAKLHKLTQPVHILRWQGVNRLNGATTPGTTIPGYFTLPLTVNQADAAGSQKFPLHLIDLTTVSQGSTNPMSMHYQLVGNDAGQMNFNPVSGQSSTGGTISFWNTEMVTDGSSISTDRFIQHDWFDLRLNLYGACEQTTFYDIMVVSFTKSWLEPALIGNPVPGEQEKLNAYYGLWQGLVKNISFNPILPGQKDAFQGMKVHRRYRKIIGSTMATENDANPNNHIFKLFFRDGKIRDYNYGAPAQASDAAVNSAQFQTSLGLTTNLPDVRPRERERLFVIIRASNTTPTTLAAENDAGVTPSYDLCLRTRVRRGVNS